MTSQPDEPTDYTLLAMHQCPYCQSGHRLAALPVSGGWDVCVRCRCVKRGSPVAYSTEAGPFPTFSLAETAIADLLRERLAA